MKLIIGLGNPGMRYRNNRHNVGFMAIDAICSAHDITLKKKGLSLLYAKPFLYDNELVLAKPLSYMNMSGGPTRIVASYYKIKPSDIIVVFDDFAIPFGKIRIRTQGSDGGHNGIKSIIEHLGTNNFTRIRIGIGREGGIKYSASYVLSDFNKAEKEHLGDVLSLTEDAIKTILLESVEKSMNLFN